MPAARTGGLPSRWRFSRLGRQARWGRVPGERIDDAALRVLRRQVWFADRTGRAGEPDRYTPAAPAGDTHRALAREVAERSLVLRRNEKVGIGPAGYIASKFAVVGFSEALSLAWARDGITVTQLNPGFIATEGFPQQQVLRSKFAGVVGRPDDISDAVVDVLVRRPRERTAPRWYRAVVVVRHVLPGLFWRLAALTPRARGTRD